MYDSEVLPASLAQRHINRVSNADLGIVLQGIDGPIRKLNHGQIQYVNTGEVLDNGTYFGAVQSTTNEALEKLDKTDPSEPAA